jgi:hypothetical protein
MRRHDQTRRRCSWKVMGNRVPGWAVTHVAGHEHLPYKYVVCARDLPETPILRQCRARLPPSRSTMEAPEFSRVRRSILLPACLSARIETAFRVRSRLATVRPACR